MSTGREAAEEDPAAGTAEAAEDAQIRISSLQSRGNGRKNKITAKWNFADKKGGGSWSGQLQRLTG